MLRFVSLVTSPRNKPNLLHKGIPYSFIPVLDAGRGPLFTSHSHFGLCQASLSICFAPFIPSPDPH